MFLTLSGRCSTCDIEDAAENGLIADLMHFNTVFRALRREDVTPILLRLVAESSRPLAVLETDAAMDSTGLSTGERVSWYDKKYGRDNDFTDWRKLHFLCGTRTHTVICAVPSTGPHHDNQYFRTLIQAIPPDFRLEALSADKAYLDAANFDLLEAIKITPYIPF